MTLSALLIMYYLTETYFSVSNVQSFSKLCKILIDVD